MPGPCLRRVVPMVAIGVFALAAGCTPTAPAPPPNGGPPPPMGAPIAELEPGPFLEGRKVFQMHRCGRCHSIGNQASKGKMKKSLTTVGKDRSREWIIAHIRDPHTHNPKSKMPASDSAAINDADMTALADYLTSLSRPTK